jgi:hypothetical protein
MGPIKPFDPPNNSGKPISSWDALSRGQTLGKKAVIFYPGSNQAQFVGNINILGIQSNDNKNALQLCVTLSPLLFLPSSSQLIAMAAAGDIQNVSGEMDNQNLLNIASSVPVNLVEAYATIEFGIGGVSNKVDCDISNGLVLNLSSSFVRGSVTVDALNIPGGGTTGAYILSAFVGPGTAKANNAQRTLKCAIDTDITNISGNYAIPRYAKAVTLNGVGLPAQPNTFDATISFYSDNNCTIGTEIAQSQFNSTTHYPIVVPNGAYFFTMIDNHAIGSGSSGNINAVFDLAV